MARNYRVLMLGASYGSLFGMKLALAGHDVTLVCLAPEREAIDRDGVELRLPIRGRETPLVLRSAEAPGRIDTADTSVDPAGYDMVGLAMQEPQYRAPGVRELLERTAAARVPAVSIMNMPPLAYLRRLPGLDTGALEEAYTDARVWDGVDPAAITLASPDPQAFRPPEAGPNVLQVSLPTNFKIARFEDEGATAMLREMAAGVDALDHEGASLPVKLRVFESPYVPLAKWAMLLAGNYRCVTPTGLRSIREAVHDDPALSREVYDFVCRVARGIGAAEADLVPFEKYAAAAEGLVRPSSAARALDAGAPAIERVDRLVQAIGRRQGLSHPAVDEVVALVDERLARSRAAA
ncbi:MAG: ketopantoate reductase family protein [Paracoccaceae bacterium]